MYNPVRKRQRRLDLAFLFSKFFTGRAWSIGPQLPAICIRIMPTSRFEASSIKNKIKRDGVARKLKRDKRQAKLQKRLAQAKVEADDPVAKKVSSCIYCSVLPFFAQHELETISAERPPHLGQYTRI